MELCTKALTLSLLFLNTWAAMSARTATPTPAFSLPRLIATASNAKRMPVEHLIQSLIERMPARNGQLVRRNPQPRRACPVLASSHGHAGV